MTTTCHVILLMWVLIISWFDFKWDFTFLRKVWFGDFICLSFSFISLRFIPYKNIHIFYSFIWLKYKIVFYNRKPIFQSKRIPSVKFMLVLACLHCYFQSNSTNIRQRLFLTSWYTIKQLSRRLIPLTRQCQILRILYMLITKIICKLATLFRLCKSGNCGDTITCNLTKSRGQYTSFNNYRRFSIP